MREEAGFEGQAEFARAADIDPRNYEKYENRSMLPLYYVPNVARALKKSIEEVLAIVEGGGRQPIKAEESAGAVTTGSKEDARSTSPPDPFPGKAELPETRVRRGKRHE